MLNIKKALTELSNKVTALKNNGPIIENHSQTYDIGASTSLAVDFPITVPNGYKFGLAVLTSTGKAGVLARDVLYQTADGTTKIRIYVDNIKTTAFNDCKAQVRVMYMPNTWGGGNKLPYPLNRIAQILRRKEVGVC